jgi:hypothetical protein
VPSTVVDVRIRSVASCQYYVCPAADFRHSTVMQIAQQLAKGITCSQCVGWQTLVGADTPAQRDVQACHLCEPKSTAAVPHNVSTCLFANKLSY